MAAEQRIFISYSHRQGDWVVDHLLPVLRAAGAGEVLIDRQRFIAGRAVKGQMDATQDQANRHLLVLSPEYRRNMQSRAAHQRRCRRDRSGPVGHDHLQRCRAGRIDALQVP